MSVRVRVPGLISKVSVVVICATGPLLHTTSLHSQEYLPFTEQGERQFRASQQRYREQISSQPNNINTQTQLYQDRFGLPLSSYDDDTETRRENRIETSDNGTEFRDNPFISSGENQSRLEANGGERNLDIDIEQQARQNDNNRENRSELSSTGDLQNDPLNRDEQTGAESERSEQAILEGRREEDNTTDQNAERDDDIDAGNQPNDPFEDEFLAAERELANGDEPNPQTPANLRNNRNAAGENDTRQLVANPQRQRNINGFDQNRADDNDITGSINNNEIENIYAQQGKRIGSFYLFSQLTFNGVYSDNPTASLQNGPGDSSIEIIPQFQLRSDWTRHALEIDGQLTKSYYEELTSENVEEWNLGARARLDIQSNHFFEFAGRIEKTQDDRGEIDNLNSDTELADVHMMQLTALYNYQWNRTTLQIQGGVTDYDYDDVGNGLGAIINNDDRDYLQSDISLRMAFTAHPGFYVFGEASYLSRDFNDRTDDNGFERSAEGETIRAGFIFDITSKVRLSANLGYQWLFADEARYNDLEEVVYNAELNYRPTTQTTLTLATAREIDNTDLDGTIGVLQTDYSIALNHYFLPHILLNTSLNYRTEEFLGVDIDQNTLTAALTVQYIFNQHARLIAGYEYSEVSNNDGTDYHENQFRLGLNLRP